MKSDNKMTEIKTTNQKQTIKENENKTIYLLGEIVHNKIVTDKYLKLGVKIISENDLDTTPPAPDFKIQFIDEALLPIIPAASINGF